MKNRIKIALPSIESRDEAEALVGEVALITLNQIRATAKMDAEITQVRQKYEGNLAEISAQLKTKTDTLRAWAESNPDEFPKGRKSIQFVQGTLGFRTGTPTVVLLNRSWTWAKVITEIKRWKLDAVANFIRSKEKVARDVILAANSHAKDAADHAEHVLKPIGLKIAKQESFFIEPNITEVEIRQAQEVA